MPQFCELRVMVWGDPVGVGAGEGMEWLPQTVKSGRYGTRFGLSDHTGNSAA